MADLPLTEEGLKELRVKAAQEFNDAKARGMKDAQDAAQKMLEEIDDALDDLSLDNLKKVATELKTLQAAIDAAKEKAGILDGLADAVTPKEKTKTKKAKKKKKHASPGA
jgi:hypothetical protein